MAEEPKERKAFEAHMRVGGYSNHDKHPDGSYVSSAMELWWQGWKARAQLPSQVVEVGWREHSVNYAKGEKCPETIETLQAAWDRDQELINDMRHEIARHKTRINRLEQRRPADQVADGVVVSRERLEHWADKLEDSESNGYGWEDALAAELRALLNGGRE